MDHEWWIDDGKSVKCAALTNRTNFIYAVFIANSCGRPLLMQRTAYGTVMSVYLPVSFLHCGQTVSGAGLTLHTDTRIDYWVRLLGLNSHHPALILNDVSIETGQVFKLLGVYISADLHWNAHVDYIVCKAASTLSFCKELHHAVLMTVSLMCYRFEHCHFIAVI